MLGSVKGPLVCWAGVVRASFKGSSRVPAKDAWDFFSHSEGFLLQGSSGGSFKVLSALMMDDFLADGG